MRKIYFYYIWMQIRNKIDDHLGGIHFLSQNNPGYNIGKIRDLTLGFWSERCLILHGYHDFHWLILDPDFDWNYILISGQLIQTIVLVTRTTTDLMNADNFVLIRTIINHLISADNFVRNAVLINEKMHKSQKLHLTPPIVAFK